MTDVQTGSPQRVDDPDFSSPSWWNPESGPTETNSSGFSRAVATGQSNAIIVALLDSIPSPAWLKDAGGRYLAANRAHLESCGRLAEEVIGFTDAEIWPSDRATHYGQTDCEVVATAAPVRVEERAVYPDGTERWFETTKVPYRDDDGQVLGTVGVAHDITERRAATIALQQSEARFRTSQDELRRSEHLLRQVLDSLPVHVGVMTPDGELTQWINRTTLTATGVSLDDMVGQHAVAKSRLSATGRDRFRRALERARTGQPARFDLHLPSAAGRDTVMDCSLVPLHNADGVVTHLVGSAIDISERVRAVEEMRASEERFRMLSEFMPQFVWSTTPDGYHDYFNQRWYDYTGMPRTEPQGWNWKLYLHPDDYDRTVGAWQQSLDTGEPYEIEYRFKAAATGEYRWFIGRALPMRDDRGKVVRWFGTCTDVHEERLAKEAQAQSEARYLAVARATHDVIWDLDLLQGSAWWNDELQNVLGVAPAAVQSVEDWGEHIHPEDRDRVVSGFLRAVDGGAPAWADEYRFICGDGRIATVLDRGSVLRDRDGRPTRMIGSIIDLTERKRLEEELQQVQKMDAIGRLAGGVAHDFNNLLTVIISYADMIKGDIRAADPIREDVEQIVKAAERAAGLTRQLLAFSRRQRLQPRRVDVNDVVTDLEKLLHRLIGEDIHLTVTPSETPAYVVADVGQVEQVLLNLAVNARDALQPDGRITLRVTSVMCVAADAPGTPAKRHVQISVVDSGTGIPPEVLPRIFEPFFTTKPAGAGTGLGLATVYGIVKQSGGHIEVETTPGQGTEFKILLPWDDADEPTSNVGPSGPRRPIGAHECVLLVEDEPELRGAARRMLTRSGYTVIEAADGIEALAVLERRPGNITLVVSDLVMPRMGGREMMERANERGIHVPVLFMSGYTDDEIYRRAAFPEDTMFLEKPFTRESLLDRVWEVLNARRTAHPDRR